MYKGIISINHITFAYVRPVIKREERHLIRVLYSFALLILLLFVSEKRLELECLRSKVSRCLLDGLQELFEEKRHCDIDIVIEKRTFSCHKVVLSAASKYFDVMFSSGLQESRSRTIYLNDINSKTFTDILAFLYCGKDIVNDENAEGLLKASNLLQMTCLQSQCEEFLLENICAENCIGLWLIAKSYCCKKLEAAAWPFLLEHFDEIWDKEEFIKLELDDLITIISDDDLKVRREETVCQAILKWIKVSASRESRIGELLPHIRLAHVGLDFLLDEIYSNPLIYKNDVCMKIVKDSVKYHALLDRRHTFKAGAVMLRNSCPMTSLFVVIGRRLTSSGIHVTDTVAYKWKDSKWYSLCSLPFDIGEEFTTCPYGDDIFISGGTVKPEAFLRFSANQYKWCEKNSMTQGRYRHAMVALKDSIFCLGGYYFGTLKSIEEFDIGSGMWQPVGELKYAVDAMSASVLGCRIFLFGGWLGFAEETNIIQCFDTLTQNCFVVGNLPSPCKDSRALTVNKTTYIISAKGEIFVFSPDYTTKIFDKIDNFSKTKFGIYKDDNALYIIGGAEVLDDAYDTICSDEIIAINADKSETGTLPKALPTSLEVYGCYKVVIKNKYPLIEFAEQFA